MKKSILKVLALMLLTVLAVLPTVSCGGEKERYCYAEIVTDHGTITLRLDRENAPITVDNFVSLAEDGFYDGLTFHRAQVNFMIQGGDPKANGSGDSGKTIKGEFSSNGVDNKISHKRGVISMARSDKPNSASCQFFICNADSEFLDGNYAAFGEVIDGLDVVDAITAMMAPYGDGKYGTVSDKSKQVVITEINVISEAVATSR